MTGTATVLVEGDALVSDAGIVSGNVTEYATVITFNSADAAAQWVDCVAC